MVNFCAVCGCCTRTDIVRERLEDTLRICDVSAMGLYLLISELKQATFLSTRTSDAEGDWINNCVCVCLW